MKILKQTATQLVTRHEQSGKRLAIGCFLSIAAGAILVANIIPEITCQRTEVGSQCKLIRRTLGGLKLEQAVNLKSVKSRSICGFSRGKKASCSGTQALVIVQTQIGDIQFIVSRSNGKNHSFYEVEDFIKNLNRTSLQIQSSGWSPNYPLSNGFLCLFALLMFFYSYKLAVSERIYTCEFDKMGDRVTVKQHKSFKNTTTELSISAIKSISVCTKSCGDCIVLYLHSGEEVCIAEAVWGKKILKDQSLLGDAWVNQDLEKDRQAIASFLGA